MTILNLDESESDMTSATFTLSESVPAEAHDSVVSAIEYIYPEADGSDIVISGDKLRISVSFAEKMDRSEVEVLCASIEQAVKDYFSTKSKILARLASKMGVELLKKETKD